MQLTARSSIDDDGVALRPDRLRRAAACARQLDLRPDLLELRLCPQVADRPRHPGQRRVLPARPRPGAGRHVVNATHPAPVVGGWETAMRVVETLYVGALAGPARARAGRFEGDDLPRRVRRAQPARRRAVRVPRDGRRRVRRAGLVGRAGRRPAAPAEHGERAGRGDRDQLPGPHHPLRADRGVRRSGHAIAAASACGATTRSRTTCRSRSSPIATSGGRRDCSAARPPRLPGTPRPRTRTRGRSARRPRCRSRQATS